MMEIILTLMFLLVVIIVLFWLKKTLFVFGLIFRLFGLLMLLCFVGSIVFGYYIIQDAKDFKNNFGNSTNVILVQDTINDTGMVTGIIFNPKESKFSPLTKEQLTYFQNSYSDNKFSDINSKYYKIFVMDIESFKDLEFTDPKVGKINLTKEELTTIMISSNAKTELAKIISKKTGANTSTIISQLSVNNEEVKSYILTYYLSTLFNPSNIFSFVEQLSSDGIKVYENTALFKAIRLLPNSMLKLLVG